MTVIDTLLKVFDDRLDEIELLRRQVHDFFLVNKDLTRGVPPIVHSVKSRVKDRNHLKDKIERKLANGDKVTTENIFDEITDLAGVRVMHLYQGQFKQIDDAIREQISRGNWVLAERPKAYMWDPESKIYFEKFDLELEQKESFYTSIHYLVKPHEKFEFCCEIQVRTLFEEIWGEIDHSINYPHPTENIACKEQLRVLSKLAGAGSRLADSIFRSLE